MSAGALEGATRRPQLHGQSVKSWMTRSNPDPFGVLGLGFRIQGLRVLGFGVLGF